MSGLFGGAPKAAAPIVPAPAPQVTDADAQAASNAERQRIAAAAGRSSTILTGADSAPVVVPTKTLLGSA